MGDIAVKQGGRMAEHDDCLICGGNQANYFRGDYYPQYDKYECPRCGTFDYDTGLGWWNVMSPDEMVLLSGWVREQNAAGIKPVRMTPEKRRLVVRMRPPGLCERADHALSVIARKYPDMENTTRYIRIAGDLEVQG